MDLSSTLRRSNVSISGTPEAGAPTIVFLHGLGADQASWRLLAPAFEDRYRVLLLDLVGAGRSDAAAYDYARHGSLTECPTNTTSWASTCCALSRPTT